MTKKGFQIKGGNKLFGEVDIPCSKNAILPIMAASIMCESETVLHSCPNITDIDSMLKLLNEIGVLATREGKDIIIKPDNINCNNISQEVSSLFRSSIFLMGAMISKCKYAKIAKPGGCAIGARGIDIHIEGLKKLNVDVVEEENFTVCDGKNIRPANIYLKFPSVGATENLMLASVFVKGKTKIFNCAREPEIVDLQNFLNKCGANISGAGTGIITICGVEKLQGVEYTAIPDRIVAGTLIAAAGLSKGKICLNNAESKYLEVPLKLFEDMGLIILKTKNTIKVNGDFEFNAIQKITTEPFPGFPTDLQSVFMSMLSISKGESIIQEKIFENRFQNAEQLNKMGAKIEINNDYAIIQGVKNLTEAEVEGKDLRGVAALVIAALSINGTSSVYGAQYIDRGYESFEKILNNLGADVSRI